MVRSPGRAGPPRVGLVVPRAVGKAVRRNRIRRRLRHAVRALQLEADMDYVIIASPQVATAQFADLVAWLGRAHRDLTK
jgi:ribonuclease P protein component